MLSASDGLPPQEKMIITDVVIPCGKEVEAGVVFYEINVSGGGSTWAVSKRYSQFEEFHQELLLSSTANSLPLGVELPGKRLKLFYTHNDKDFIEERRCLLESYLKHLVSVKKIAGLDMFIRFMSADKHEVKEHVPPPPEMPDDVEVTAVSIPSTRTMSDHVLYQIDVLNIKKRSTFSKWTVLKRFGQFHEMDAALRASFADDPSKLALLPPPPKRQAKVLWDHMDEAFVEQRRVLLENYLTRMITCVPIVRSEIFLAFLGVSV